MIVGAEPGGDMADTKVLRQILGTFATGVTVVTTGGPTPHGMTANAFTSVSLDPPLVLICVGQGAVMHGKLSGGSFGVSVLASGQETIARHFANLDRPIGAAQFDGIGCNPGRLTGVPLIRDALARLECEIWERYEGGDHTIFIGRLLSVDRSAETPDGALLFYRGRFRRLESEPSEVTT
jgi:flavin reductase